MHQRADVLKHRRYFADGAQAGMPMSRFLLNLTADG
ncbi:hypothetical protein ABIB10_005908 [Bradyrhizobium sp. RT3b]